MQPHTLPEDLNNEALPRQRRGFTLLELLVTTSLIAVIGLAIYSTFARGVMVWNRVNKISPIEDDARFELEKIARELKNSFRFSKIDFAGAKDAISFPTYINTAGAGERPAAAVGRVTYFFLPKEGAILRRQEDYADLFSRKPPDAKVALPGVSGLAVEYYYYDIAQKSYLWKDAWDNKAIRPNGVRFTLSLVKAGDKKFVKTIYFP